HRLDGTTVAFGNRGRGRRVGALIGEETGNSPIRRRTGRATLVCEGGRGGGRHSACGPGPNGPPPAFARRLIRSGLPVCKAPSMMKIGGSAIICEGRSVPGPGSLPGHRRRGHTSSPLSNRLLRDWRLLLCHPPAAFRFNQLPV